ncbi:MAG: DegT/DnrJ/EryC1/StrS family aminotransferase [Elusimicrobia bacterium]|nr:DegT/DnrJ/EryC1/StrS family aminotransferase [Elusimicrobiota bacterium]
MKIPLLDVSRQYRGLAPALRRAAIRVLDSGRYILGEEGRLFEQEFAKASRLRHVIGLSSGTAALEIGLKALGLGPGDEVIVPAFTFIATASAVSAVGATPVLADVDPDALTLGPAQIEAALTPKTKALIPVHLYGRPAPMEPIMALARRRGLKVLEDCAQSHLSLHCGKPIGSFGHAAAFSFYPSKNLGALGDAGAIATQDETVARACLELRNAGRPPVGASYRHVRLGYNGRLDELQAALLRVKLGRLSQWTQRRRELAGLYNEKLAELPLRLPESGAAGDRHSFHLYVIRTARRDELARFLAGQGIGTGVYYPIPVHLQPAYRGLKHKTGDFPVSEEASRTVLALPLFPELSRDAVLRVCREIRRFFRR